MLNIIYLLFIYSLYELIGRWGTHLYMSFFPSIHPSVHPSVRHALNLRNHTSSDQSFWSTYVKWWYLHVFFFLNCDFRAVKGQKNSPKWKITITSFTHHTQEQYSIWLYLHIMSRTHFRVNLHSIFAWMSRNSLLETGVISEV